ncbi:hypothetical protein [Celeribacter baekdonensis]|uniref:Uncharacterized protein n=1 Tax=Celeribacter baekdonensis TaxID=875171 RepID=A0A2R4M280_9RHOB|nr:hypothetical protein [Celeribacter baekdonensis]AVW91310.1 hypothetical protein DA792_09640 [Celeribacter baekdonensis]|tara:strand:+ start:25799 stop:26065 length:267 start_codon:yes stop_codon:yes gene_type:complete
MDGIVLWSDPEAHTAVIWCSDHGDLAYASGLDSLVGVFSMPETGTMVSIKTRYENGMRICDQLMPIQRYAAPEIATHLREWADAVTAA